MKLKNLYSWPTTPVIWNAKRGIWEGKKKRCRACRVEIDEGDLCVYVTGLYVLFEQNFVIQTNFYFCPETRCVNRSSCWTNLKTPKTLVADSSVTNDELKQRNLGQTKLTRK